MTELKIDGLVKRYGDAEVLHGLDLDVEGNEFIVFVGPSGCGKSTFLRSIAGLEDISGGTIAIDGTPINGLEPDQRGVAMVFQNYALYPHMTVAENMGFALKMAGVSKPDIATKVNAAAEILKLEPYLGRRPADLSGGQRQRVAIGRAIVRAPKVFLFDEPLSNLDADLRAHMRLEIIKLHRQQGAISIYVTHDQVEAMTMADRIVVMRDGYIEQVGSPLELYNNPVNRFVAGFLGTPKMNFLPARVTGLRDATATFEILGTSIAVEIVDGEALSVAEGAEIEIGIRADGWDVVAEGEGMAGQVVHAEQLGRETVTFVMLEGDTQVTMIQTGQHQLKDGEAIWLKPAAARLHGFDGNGLSLPIARQHATDA
ncbi:ABC transporter ATP-binding protein [Cucumibacter marinus]|uniref:ABC transporter ATP-binding protein n=1 Tax=Cucumibacter marinus TaxID=1121252 RepID=UPI0003F56B67|nr:ABC transporter ATP-binding protein [Cucumibacter marinus]